jgi:CheY-like chemotaxis protein
VATGRQAKILLVDDREDNLVALEAILSSLHREMVRATSGEQALKQLLVDDFAVILLDVQMPGMDGFETAQRIKQRERTRATPIIFLTALDRESKHAFRGYSVGAVDYIAKPFDPWLLRSKVEVFLELFEARLGAATPEAIARALGLAREAYTRSTEAPVRQLLAATIDELGAAILDRGPELRPDIGLPRGRNEPAVSTEPAEGDTRGVE